MKTTFRSISQLFFAVIVITTPATVSSFVVVATPSIVYAQSTSSGGSSSGGGSSGISSGAIGTGVSVVSGLLSGGGLNLGSLIGTLTGLLGQFGSSLGLSSGTTGIISSIGSSLGSLVGGGGLSSGNIGGIVGAIGSIANLPAGSQQIAQQIAGIVPGVIQSISSGNINGIVNGLLGIFGLLNPQQVQNTVLSPSGSGGIQIPSTGQTVYPVADATTPYGVRYASRLAEKYKTDQFYKNSQIVLSEEGYDRIEANLETSSASLQQSGQVAGKMLEWDDIQVEAANTSIEGADFSLNVGKNLVQYKASQDVLKAIGTLLAANNIQNGINAGQQTYISRNLAGLGTQMAGLQGQMRIISEQTSVLELLGGNQLQQQGQMAQYLDQLNSREEADNLMGPLAGATSMKNITIYGYLPPQTQTQPSQSPLGWWVP